MQTSLRTFSLEKRNQRIIEITDKIKKPGKILLFLPFEKQKKFIVMFEGFFIYILK